MNRAVSPYGYVPHFGVRVHAMTCGELTALLMQYLDDELSEPTRSDMEQHLAACGDCSAFLASYTTTVQLLQTVLR